MRLYELIDTTDNDCWDTGTLEDMIREADARNEYDRRELFHIAGIKRHRWIVRAEGYSDRNYRGEL